MMDFSAFDVPAVCCTALSYASRNCRIRRRGAPPPPPPSSPPLLPELRKPSPASPPPLSPRDTPPPAARFVHHDRRVIRKPFADSHGRIRRRIHLHSEPAARHRLVNILH